jgi:SAM-dependent methyltransferase
MHPNPLRAKGEGALVAADYDRVAGPVCDAGCGPGHVTRYLHERGCQVFGVDISPQIVELARSLNSELEPLVADLRELPVEEGSLAGVVAFYGDEVRQPGEMWGVPVELQFTFFTYEQLKAALLDARLTIEQITHRSPYPGVEVETERLYAMARRE